MYGRLSIQHSRCLQARGRVISQPLRLRPIQAARQRESGRESRRGHDGPLLHYGHVISLKLGWDIAEVKDRVFKGADIVFP